MLRFGTLVAADLKPFLGLIQRFVLRLALSRLRPRSLPFKARGFLRKQPSIWQNLRIQDEGRSADYVDYQACLILRAYRDDCPAC